MIKRGVMAFALIMVSMASALPQSSRQGPRPELRPIYATPPEIIEGKRVAEVSCARCHGAAGISNAAGVPHIAAQRSPYLYAQLRAYLQGLRPQSPMAGAVKFLSDDALMKVSAYYATLDPARPAPTPKAAASAKAGADPVQAGKAAASACGGCHGDAGVSAMAGTPNLVGLDPKYLVSAMSAYRSGARKHDLMKGFVAGMSEADLGNVALFYALQKPARATSPASGDAKAGKAAAAACAGCHGENGIAPDPATPSLAGQDAQYLAVATQQYKDGGRKDEVMKGVAGGLDDKTIKDIAAHYSAQQPQAPKVRKPLSLAEWAERCDRCHGVNGNSTDPLVPAIAAQRADWLEQVLAAYRTGARKSPAMGAMTSVMSEAEAKEIAAHYSRQGARAVTFVPIPAK